MVQLFNSNIKFSPNHDPKFRAKVSDKTQFFDVSDTELTAEVTEGLYKQNTGAAFIQFGNIYFFNKRFGITWTIMQMKVYEAQRIHGFNFADPEPEDDDDTPVVKLTGCKFA